ncbi:MAG: hypothetical protein JF587_24085 [Catenulisporales bacterium]|nr:hypothetical protein [Catenulisporales bacterium]
MARPTVVAWAVCAVLAVGGSLTVGGVAAAKVREGFSGLEADAGSKAGPGSGTVALTLPASAPGEQDSLPVPVNAGGADKTGGSITKADLDAFLAAHTAALKGKNRAGFLAAVDPQHADLVKKQGQLYDNLQKIPFTTAAYAVNAMDGGESTFIQGARATVTVAFDHQISGVDSAPVEERYKWTVERTGANGALEVTAVEAPNRRHGYPAPWDSVAGLTVLTRSHVVVMADDTSAAFAKSRADALESDAEYDFGHWTGGSGTAPGFAVFLTSDRKAYEGVYDQGRQESVGVTVPLPAAGEAGDSGTYPSSRIAVDTSQYKNLDPADADIVFKHEMAHAMIEPFEDLSGRSGQEHLWVIEGFAEWESQRMYATSRLLYDGDTLHAYMTKHGAPKALPTDEQVYSSDSDTSGLGYFYSHMAMRYMADKYSPEKVDQFVLSVYKNATKSGCVDDAMKNVLGTTTDQFTQGYAAWVRSSV